VNRVQSENASNTMTLRTVHGVRVATLTPPRYRRTCVVAMGFGAWLDPYELQRFSRLADQLDARLVVAESPGLGLRGASLTGQERAALLTGRYGPVALRMLEAAINELPAATPVHLLGYSMGASLATAMTAHSPATPVTSLTLIEPVATRARSPVGLMASVHREDHLIDSYLQENAAISGSIAPSDRTRGAAQPARNHLDQALMAAALCWGRLPEDLKRCARRQPPLPVLIVHGRTSQLARPEDVATLASTAADMGLDTTTVAVEGSHGLWQSLPRVDELALHIEQFWSTT